MNLIAAADENWGIGKNGGLLAHISGDMKYFRETTKGKVVVMGRKTLESMPGAQPLYGRTNIILTSDLDYKVKGATVCGSMEEVMELLNAYHTDDVYIIGGESVYRQFLPYCDEAQITWIDFAYAADTHFPNLDQDADWEMVQESDEQTYFDLCYEYRLYKKK